MKEEEINLREKYKLKFSPNQRIATGNFETFNIDFHDGKKRYLRALSILNDAREIDVNLITSEVIGVPYTHECFFDHGFSTPNYAGSDASLFSWNGDLPFLGGIKVNTYGNEIGDELTLMYVYEEE